MLLKEKWELLTLEITWLIQKCTSGKVGFVYTQESDFLEIQVSGKQWGFFNRWEFKHMEICSPQALSVLHGIVRFVIFKTPELAVEALRAIS